MDDPRITPEPADKPVVYRDDLEDDAYARRLPFRGADYRKDRDHLNLLSIFWFILCGMQCFGLVILIPYTIFLLVMASSGGFGGGAAGPPPEFFYFMATIMGLSILLTGVLGTCNGLTGYYLRKRKHPTFCFVAACLACAFHIPLGTILGIFTIMVLQRESVKELFRRGDQPDLQAGRGEDDDGYYPR
jgi:hypothetical protein